MRKLLAPLALLFAVPAALPVDADAASQLTQLFAATHRYDRFNVQGSIDQVMGSPALGDVTGDGVPDIVVGGMDGTLRVLDSSNGAVLRSVDVDTGSMIQSAPTLVNTDGDATLEVVIGTVRRVVGNSGVRIYDMASNPPGLVFNQASSAQSNDAGFLSSPVVGDVDGDGSPDVVAIGFDQRLHAWRLDGSDLPGFPVYTYDTSLSTPALADIDGDGKLDIVAGGDMDHGQPLAPGGYLWVVKGNGQTVPGYPVRMGSEVIWSSPAVGDVDADGDPDIVVGTGRNFGSSEQRTLYAIDARTRAPLAGWPKQLDANSMASPALGNLDGDPQLEVVTMSGSGRVLSFEHDGGPRWSTCARATWAGNCPSDVAIIASPVLADVDNDGGAEVIVAGEREIVVLDAGSGAVEARAGTVSTENRYTWPGANAPAVGMVGGRMIAVIHVLVDNGDDRRGAGDEQGVWAWSVGSGGSLPWAQWHGGPAHLGAFVQLGPGGFTDTAGHSHGANIAKVAQAGITGGYPDGTFRPNAIVTRAQMAAFIQRAYGLPPADSPTFPDVVGTTHEPAIRSVASKGIATGGTDGRYRPNEGVSRGQMAAFLARAEGLDLDDPTGPVFCDTIGHAFEREIRAVARAGIANGTGGCSYNPNGAVTRGQMATFLVNALGL